MAITSAGAVDYHFAVQAGNLSVNQLGTFTLSAWVNAATWTGGNTHSMVGLYTNATTGGGGLQFGTRSGAGAFDIWYWGGTVLISSSGLFSMVNNTWYHLAYTYNGTTHQMYINGALITTSTVAQLAGTDTTVYVNGFPTGTTTETGLVTVDDIRVYNRVLQASEIATIYNSEGCADGITYGQQYSALFNESTTGANVTLCLDYTGNGNTMTPIGAATGVNFVYATSPITADTRPVQG